MNKVIITAPFEIVSYSSAAEGESKDLMRVKFELCHEGVNNNGDRFTKASLDYSYKTIINKPINWEHGEPNIGVVTSSSIEERNNISYVVCEGEIWKYKYAEESEEIKSGYASGDIKVSMECYFPDCNFILGDYDEIINDSEASDEIRESRGGEYKGKLVSREFIRPFFGGVGVTTTAADKEAVFLAAAKVASDREETHKHKQLNASGALKLFEVEDDTEWSSIHDEVYESALELVSAKDIKEHESNCKYCKSKKEVSDILNKKTEEVKEEVKVEDTKAADKKDEKTEVTENKVEFTADFSGFEELLAAAVKDIKAIVSPEEEKEEDSEIVVAHKRIEELEKELEDAKSENTVLIADNLGLERLEKLSNAGISFTEEQLSDKKKVFGGMGEEVFASYFTDITSVKEASASQESTDTLGDIVPGSLNLEDDEDKTLSQQFVEMYSKN